MLSQELIGLNVLCHCNSALFYVFSCTLLRDAKEADPYSCTLWVSNGTQTNAKPVNAPFVEHPQEKKTTPTWIPVVLLCFLFLEMGFAEPKWDSDSHFLFLVDIQRETNRKPLPWASQHSPFQYHNSLPEFLDFIHFSGILWW